MRIEDEAPLSLVAVIRGEAYVTAADEPARAVRHGDVLIALGPVPYVFGRRPRHPGTGDHRPWAALPQPERRTAQRAPRPGDARLAHRGRTATSGCAPGATPPPASTPAAGRHLSDAQRRRAAAHLGPARRWPSCPASAPGRACSRCSTRRSPRTTPGQDVVLDRLLDLLLVAALRAWFSRPDATAPRWYLAGDDPVIGPVLRLLVDNPAHAWTVAGLAAAARLSRAAFARRFTELVGEPPIAFLAGWRLAMAADLLSRHRRHAGHGGPPGGLRQPVRAQHRVQAGSRGDPPAAPAGVDLGNLTARATPRRASGGPGRRPPRRPVPRQPRPPTSGPTTPRRARRGRRRGALRSAGRPAQLPGRSSG